MATKADERGSQAPVPGPHPLRLPVWGFGQRGSPKRNKRRRSSTRIAALMYGAMTPVGIGGVLNDAVSSFFAGATLASTFVARGGIGLKVEARVCSKVREDERVGATA